MNAAARPHRVTNRQRDALRVLVIFLKGTAEGWRALTALTNGDAKFQRRLYEFTKNGGELDEKGSTDKLPLLMEFLEIEIPKHDYYSTLKPIYEIVFPKPEKVKNPEDYRWWELERWATPHLDMNHDFDDLTKALAEQIEGIFELYRYGSMNSAGPELVRSVLQLTLKNVDGHLRLYFLIRYPDIHEQFAPHDEMIRGEVIPTEHHLYLLGYDRGSRTPYMLVLHRHRFVPKIQALHGLLLRLTTSDILTAARVYGIRTSASWQDACKRVQVLDFKNFKKNNGAMAENIQVHIDNKVDNRSNFVLTKYASKREQEK